MGIFLFLLSLQQLVDHHEKVQLLSCYIFIDRVIHFGLSYTQKKTLR
jgi:hypothetical protein